MGATIQGGFGGAPRLGVNPPEVANLDGTAGKDLFLTGQTTQRRAALQARAGVRAGIGRTLLFVFLVLAIIFVIVGFVARPV